MTMIAVASDDETCDECGEPGPLAEADDGALLCERCWMKAMSGDDGT
jgi:hypothetical protein